MLSLKKQKQTKKAVAHKTILNQKSQKPKSTANHEVF